MKKSQYLRLAIILGIVVAGAFVFVPRGQALGIGAAMGAMMAMIVVGQLSAPKAFILKHPRAVAVAGWTTAGSGLVVALALGWKSDESTMVPGMMVSVAGVALATLPRSLKVSEDIKAQAQAKASAKPSGASSALREGLNALASPLQDLRTSSVVLGPWVALFLIPPTAAIVAVLVFGADGAKRLGHGGAIAVLWALLAGIVIMYGALMIAAIQWTRFVSEGQPPKFGVPWRPLWSFAWRWIVFGGVSRVSGRFGPWLNTHAPSLPHWASSGLTNLVGLAFLTLMSPLGLVLPAIALREKDVSIARVLGDMRAYGRRYYLGALVVLSPFALTTWLLDLLPENHSDAPMAEAFGLGVLAIWIAAFFLTVVGAVTYLARVHARARSAA